MINLKTKADENYDAFVLLKDNGKLNSSIHCAYYSAFLLSIYEIWISLLRYTEYFMWKR